MPWWKKHSCPTFTEPLVCIMLWDSLCRSWAACSLEWQHGASNLYYNLEWLMPLTSVRWGGNWDFKRLRKLFKVVNDKEWTSVKNINSVKDCSKYSPSMWAPTRKPRSSLSMSVPACSSFRPSHTVLAKPGESQWTVSILPAPSQLGGCDVRAKINLTPFINVL